MKKTGLNKTIQHVPHILIRTIAFFVLFFVLNLNLKASQETDSLQLKLSTSGQDTIRLLILDQLVERIEDVTIWSPFNEEMGRLAIDLLKLQNQPIAVTQAAQKYLAAYYNNVGYLQQDIGNSIQALNSYYSGLKLYENAGNKTGIANTLINIGTIYHDQLDLQQSLNYFKKGLAIMETIHDTDGIAIALNNMGSVYNSMQKTREAITCFETSIRLRLMINDMEGLGITYTNLGGIYDKLGENEKALSYYKKSFDVQMETGDELGIAYSYINFGNIFLKQKNFIKAEQNFLTAKEIAKNARNALVMLGAANWLSKLYEAWGKYQPAFEMQTLYKLMTDSIRNDETRRQSLKKQIQFDYEKKEAVIKAEQEKKDALAMEEIARQKIIRNVVVGGLLLILVSVVVILFFYKRKKEVEMLHKITESRMRAINSQMNPHFIFNCMHSIQSLVIKQDFEKADNCLVMFARLIRKVLDNSTQKEIALEDDLDTIKDYVELEKMRLDHPLTFHIQIDETLDIGNTLVPPLLLQPIIENAIIHGIKPKNCPGIIQLLVKNEQQRLRIEIIDNGTGRINKTADSTTRKSYGIALTRERLEYLGQAENFKSSYKIVDLYTTNNEPAGTKVILTLPLRNAFT